MITVLSEPAPGASPLASLGQRMIRTHQGRGELSFRPLEQHTLVHGSQATEGLRRSCDLQMGV